MQEQGKHHSSGVKSLVQEHKKLKATPVQDYGKGTSVPDEAKSLVKHAKSIRVIFSSDADRNLDGVRYRLGDMVWAKVKSHPWWPGQLYDPALASASAMEFKRDSCFLVAFFGDSTFGWFAEAELLPYEPTFAQKSKQTSAHNFVDAVEDSLDQVRRRVKLGLTCHCSSSEEASKIRVKRAGLLYDRQLHDIRRNFEPAKLLSAIKQLACSPFSFSQNMLRNTVAVAQSNAFRLLVFCNKLPEHMETEGVGESSQSHPIKAGSAELLKDKTLPEKNAAKKHQPKMSLLSKSCQGQEDNIRKQGFKEKLGGMDELGKVKQHRKCVISKKGSTEKSKDFCGDKGVTSGTASEKKSVQPVVQDKQAMSASIGKEILVSKAPYKERGIQESGQILEQSERYTASISSNRDIPGSVGKDGLTTSRNNAQQRNLKKSAGLAVKTISKVVPEAEGMELAVTVKQPKSALKKAKVAKVQEDQVLKLKTTKKFVVADVELSQSRKKVKVVSGGKDKVFKQPKRFLEDEPTDVPSRETKKRKLLLESIGKDNLDGNLCDHTGDSIASDSLPMSELPQQADKVISGSTGSESDLKYPQVESLPGETGGILPAEIQEIMVLEVGQSHQEDALRHKHVGDDATEAQDVGVFIMQPNEMQPNEADADHKSVNIFQAEITSSISKKKEEKSKDSNVFVHREVSTFQAETVLDMSKEEKTSEDTNIIDLLEPEDLSSHDHDLKGQGEEESPETSSKVIGDQTVKDLTASPSKADPSLAHFHGTSAVQAFACITVESMQDASQTKKEISSVKYGHEERKLPKNNMESKRLTPSNKVLSSKKRVVEDCISKGSKANNKRIKTLSLARAAECHADVGGEDGEEHEGLNRQDEDDTHLQNLHEGLMSVAAKPLDAVEEEFSSAVCRAFTNFRKVVYKKAVCHTGPENSVTSSAVTVSEGLIGVGNENDKMAELVTEKAEVKAISINNPTEAEPSKVEDARIQEGGDGLVSQKQPEEDSTMSQLRSTKRSVTISKPPSSSSISLRPAFEAKVPVRGSKEVLNRFGQRVPRLLDAAEKMTSLSSRVKSYSEERALVISFPRGFVLPSEKQVREVFAKFGDLNAPLTRVDSKSGYAHIVFRHTRDAEAALSSMKENPVFENARFWLKPRDADRKEIAKLGSRNTAFSDRPILSSGPLSEAKIISDKVRNKTASDREMLVCPNNVGSVGVVDRIGVTPNISSRMTEVDGKEGALQSNYGSKDAPPSLMIASASQKAPVGALGSGQGKLDGIHPGVVASSSAFLIAGPRSLASPVATDISEPFLGLLHQLHDLVVSTGFVM